MYLGNIPQDQYLSVKSQQITGNGGSSYTLDYAVSTSEEIAVFVNNVRQNVSSYTVSGDQLTLGGTISASDECWVLFLGRTVGTKTPAVGSVTNDMLSGSIATSKLADGSTFATTNGITVADQWNMTTSFTASNGDITANWSQTLPYSNYGTLGASMTESSGVFTFPSTGIWRVEHLTYVQIGSGSDDFIVQIQYNFSTNSGSTYEEHDAPLIGHYNPTDLVRLQHSFFANYDVTDSSTARFKMSTSSIGSTTTVSRIYLSFIRLGDT